MGDSSKMMHKNGKILKYLSDVWECFVIMTLNFVTFIMDFQPNKKTDKDKTRVSKMIKFYFKYFFATSAQIYHQHTTIQFLT